MAAICCPRAPSSAKTSLSSSASPLSGATPRHSSRPVGFPISTSRSRLIFCQISSSNPAPSSVLAKGQLRLLIFLLYSYAVLFFFLSFINRFRIFLSGCLETNRSDYKEIENALSSVYIMLPASGLLNSGSA